VWININVFWAAATINTKRNWIYYHKNGIKQQKWIHLNITQSSQQQCNYH